jgi:hypothetical protein
MYRAPTLSTSFRFFEIVIIGFCLLVPTRVNGALFTLTLDTEGTTTSQGYSDIEELFDQLTNSGLETLTNAYTPTSAAVAILDVRGLPAIAEYISDSNTLNFRVPSLDIDLTFDGITRDDSQDLFIEFLKGEGGSILTRLLQGFVSQTAVDPVAGNPNSLMANMAGADFNAVTQDIEIGGTDPLSTAGGTRRLLGIKLIAGTSEATGFRTNSIALPINYVIPLSNPQYQFILDMPLRYLDVENADVYDGSLGLGLRAPLHREKDLDWSITPMVRAGIVGSKNAGALQAIYSGTATSNLKLYFDNLTFAINNMVGLYQTGRVSGEYDGEYDLKNTIFRNGLSLSGRLAYQLFDESTTWKVQFVDTRITGDEWYIDTYDEIVADFGTLRREDRMTWQSLRVGAKYTFADEYEAFQLVLGYKF